MGKGWSLDPLRVADAAPVFGIGNEVAVTYEMETRDGSRHRNIEVPGFDAGKITTVEDYFGRSVER